MTESGRTKEERFILYAYEEAQRIGELDATLDRYEIGARAGLTQKGVNASFKLFIRSNFVKSLGEVEFCLTEHGVSLAKRLARGKI